MAEKKVKLFMVEGPSDETALGLILERIFANDVVRFDVVHGDVTTRLNGKTVRDVVREKLIEHVSREVYDWGDLAEIVHIVDSDGAFIGDDKVLQNEDGGGVEYRLDGIVAPNPEGIRIRNREKAAAMDKLRSIGGITYDGVSVPYRIYFMSRNLEHALHGVIGNVSDREKQELARKFRRKYRDDLDGFVFFMRDEIGVAGDHKETWEHLREGENSLHRGSNLHLILPPRELRRGS